MLGRQRQIRNQLQRLVDAALFALSFWLAWLIRSSGDWLPTWAIDFFAWFGGTPQIEPLEDFFPLMLLTIPVSLILLQTQGFYNRPLIVLRRETAWQLLKVVVMSSVGIVLAMFFAKIQLSRAVIVLFGVISFGLVMVKEELVRRYLLTTLGQSLLRKRVIVIGSHEDAAKVRHDIGRQGHSDLEIVADLDVDETSLKRFVDLLHEHSINAVLLAARHIYFGQVEKVIQACELEGVEVWMLADFFNTQISRTSMDEFYGRPMMVFRSTPDVSWQAVGKQFFDFVGAAIATVLLGWILAACAAAVKITSPGPVFFRQQRSGLNGRPFTMYKFRTMVSDAEQQKDELAAFNEMSGPVFKISDDPRITRVGRFLRRHSLDELPQLLNVLRGEMSLVGPRPLPVDETLRFGDLAHRRRLSVKPGLTCLWQVSGRSNVTDFGEWVRLDLEYIDNWSIWLDFKILLRTIPVVFMGTGAK